jgi:hypothetical protein
MNHRILYSIFLSLILISCGGGGDEPTPIPPTTTPVTNTAPTVPTLTSPKDIELCINNTIVFKWSISTDAEGNAIVYQLQIAEDKEFTKGVISKESPNAETSHKLDKGKAYYWRVKATDSNNAASTYSSTFSFYTEGVTLTNHLPFIPQLVAPQSNSTIAGLTTTLSWTGSDVDTDDVLTYDVYLSTKTTSTTKVVDNKTTNTYIATSLQPTTVYYWRVVVKDGKGGATEGQVWSFKTN